MEYILRTLVRSARGGGQDRARIVTFSGAILLVVADGAGGVAGGAEAAELVSERLCADPGGDTIDQAFWVSRLGDIDRELAGRTGETTAIGAALLPDGSIVGGSVGDSEAWIIEGERAAVLSEGQRRKPLLCTGNALPTGFSGVFSPHATLVIASDGLFKYAKRTSVLAACRARGLDVTLAMLETAAQLPNGTLQDDLGIIVARRAE